MPPKRYYTKRETSTAKTMLGAIKNAKWLIIVESPSKCTKIEEYLLSLEHDPVYGGKYACIASKGHIRTIDGLKSINTKTDFAPTFSIIEGKERHLREMIECVSRFPKENVFIATDDDREGEAIGWHICEMCELPISTTKRILFHEITQQAICDAVKNPTYINMSLVFAQHSRQVLDIVVGYTLSPLLWKHIYNDKLNGLSAGRCQTPALRIIYDHSKIAKNCEQKYTVSGSFFDKNIRFDLSRTFSTEEEMLEFLEKSRGHTYTMELTPTKETYKSPPKPFTTSRLLQTASSTLKYSPKKTMELCQQLYQAGLITYMRTDSSKYSPVFLKQVETYIQNEWGDSRLFGNAEDLENRDGANPHEAIRVTNIRMYTLPNEDKQLASMYKFIWKNTIESCMSVAKYNSRLVKISAPSTTTSSPYYGYTLEIPVFLGWKRVSLKNDATDEEVSRGVDMNMHQTGLQFYFETIHANSQTPIRANYIECNVIAEHSVNHYTEASLIHRLEELGIGRPSTFATIVETIQERGYVKKTDIRGTVVKCREYKLRYNGTATLEQTEIEKVFGNEKGKLVITPTGIIVVEFLLQYFEGLFSYDYTKDMESSLDLISESSPQTASETWNTICKECYQLIKRLQKPLAKVKKETYTLDKHNELVFHSTGASIKHIAEDGSVEYRTVKKNIDIDLGKLKNGEYTVSELIEIPNEHLGTFLGNNVLLKSGKFGLYVECGEIKASLKQMEKPADEIVLGDVIPILTAKQRATEMLEIQNELYSGDIPKDLSGLSNTYQDIHTKNGAPVSTNAQQPSIRVLTPDMSVRMGKFGTYIYYKTEKMRTPMFLNMKKYKGNCWDCDATELINWTKTTYRL
jgi:DNA topoisomerase-1